MKAADDNKYEMPGEYEFTGKPVPAPDSTGQEPVAWAVTAERGGIHKLSITRESAERKHAKWLEEWPNNNSRVRPLVFGDVAARELDVEAERRAAQQENAEFTEWWSREQACPEHNLITENAAHVAWQERGRRARSVAQSTAPVSTEQAGDAISRVEQAKVDHLTALANRFYGKPIASGIAPSPNNSPVGADKEPK